MSRLPILPVRSRLIALLAALSLSLATPTTSSQTSHFFQRDLSNTTLISNSTTSPNNPSSCPHPTAYIHQLIDHSLNTTSNNTFLQQYQLIADYWKPGGPILFYQGAENPQITCLEVLSLPAFAESLGALVVGIEHRYFGASIPYGLNVSESNTWTLEQWSALNLENVLADSVALVEWLKETREELRDSKVITFGGSYGAFLAGQLKIQHPTTFYASIPTSGVYNGFLTSTTSGRTAAYAWASWTSNVLSDLSAPAASKIRAGFNRVRSLMSTNSPSDFRTLARALNLCTVPSSSSQTATLTSFLMNYYCQNAQFGFSTPVPDFAHPGKNLVPPHQLRSLVDATLAASDGLAAIRASNEFVLARQNSSGSCVPWEGAADADTFASRQLSWINCKYFPYPSSIYSDGSTIFGETLPLNISASNINDAMCRETFGIDAVDGDAEWQRAHGVSQEQVEGQRRMFFVAAQYDPVSALGLDSWVSGGDRMGARFWYVAEAAHTEDIFRASAWDAAPLNDTRAAQLAYMQYWLGVEGE